MPDASGRFRGISVPELPWKPHPRPPKGKPKNTKRDTRPTLP